MSAPPECSCVLSGGYPPPMPGAVASWPAMMDQSKQWDYYPRREKEREKERERERPRERAHEREREREREREHSPSAMGYNRCTSTGILVTPWVVAAPLHLVLW